MCNTEPEFDFHFQSAGEIVAVFYDSEFFIGEVTNVLSPDEGEVNFLSRCTIKSNTFCWPKRLDQDIIQRKFVFCSKIELVPASTSRSIFSIANLSQIEDRFRLFVDLFC
jgi:hypothetical protein